MLKNMKMLRWPQGPVWIALLLLGAAGILIAQRSYRDMPLPPISPFEVDPPGSDEPAEFYFARLAYPDGYGGGMDGDRPWHIDSPAAERHFLQGLARLSNINARPKEVYVRSDSDDIFDYPWIYVVEPGYWELAPQDVENLREYLLRGGFIMFDDFHGTVEWTMFLRGMAKIFPERPIVELSKQDEVFQVLYDIEPGEQIPGVQYIYTGQKHEKDGYAPRWRGIYDDDGRLMVAINWNMDLGDAWEHADFPEYAERYTAMAYRMGINYVVYAMTH
jgi:hypothetical protein